MKKILWQARSPIVNYSFESGKLLDGTNGGNAYDFLATSVLKNNFHIFIDKMALMYEKEHALRYWRRMKSYVPNADVIVKEPYPIVFGCIDNKAKNVAMIHHLDETQNKYSIKHQWFFRRLKSRLQKMDLVITVSEFWKNYLSNAGCNNVKVIYNSFDVKEFEITKERIKEFKLNYNLKQDVPLIYIGNAHRQKGVYEVYNALKHLPYQLIMTGAKNYAGDLPVKFLNLNRSDYLCLLHSSDLVITFSNLIEGWNRIAHEAMLCKTPVIGSGTGGMKELLENGNQKIVKNIDNLPLVLEEVLINKDKIGQSGYDYVKRFDNSYFEKEWVKTISELINN